MSRRAPHTSAPAAPGMVGPEAYSRWRETTLGAVTEALEHRLLHRLISVIERKRVLDLGCGDGLLPANGGVGQTPVGPAGHDRQATKPRGGAPTRPSSSSDVKGWI